MPALTIRNTDDLARAGLSDPNCLHPGYGQMMARVQLGLMEKYPADAAAAWRRWQGVWLIKGKVNSTTLGCYVEPVRDFFRPHVLIAAAGNRYWGLKLSLRQAHQEGRRRKSPTVAPEIRTLLHEGMHCIANGALGSEPVVEELVDRLSVLFGYDWPTDSPHMKWMQRKAVSRYSGTNVSEFLAEALTEWTSLGPRAGVVARTVGTTIDRYLSADAPGAHEGGRLIRSKFQRMLDLEAQDPGSVRNWLVDVSMDEIPAWKRTYEEYLQFKALGLEPPTQTWKPLNLSGQASVELHLLDRMPNAFTEEPAKRVYRQQWKESFRLIVERDPFRILPTSWRSSYLAKPLHHNPDRLVAKRDKRFAQWKKLDERMTERRKDIVPLVDLTPEGRDRVARRFPSLQPYLGIEIESPAPVTNAPLPSHDLAVKSEQPPVVEMNDRSKRLEPSSVDMPSAERHAPNGPTPPSTGMHF